jgi:radical SAM superfamily enzyme YgiQ (UPF0313 family)
MISEHQNTIDRIKPVLLRTPLVVPKWSHTAPICPPLGLAYVAASLKQAGYEVRCVDALGEAPLQRIATEDNKYLYYGLSIKEILQHLAFKEFNVLFVSLMFSHDWPMTKSFIKTIKTIYPEVTMVCGGEHISACPKFSMEDCPEIDICVLGEGEETSIDILKTIEQKKSLSKVNGIVYRSGKEIIINPKRSRISQLDDIPLPAWDLFPLENYLSNNLGYGVNPGRTMPMLISRGCPFQCTFCSSPQMWTTKWQARDPDCVIEEMQFYIDKYKATNFDFYDLTAIVRKDWIIKFCQKIIKKNWNITWQMPSGTRSEALDDETLGLMILSGQKHISYAPESASKTTLQKIKKKIKVENMKKSIRSALSKGMSVKLNLMLGFPDETHREMLETLRFVLDAAFMGVSDVYLASFAPYPGSELFDQMYKNGQIPKLDDEYFLNLTSYTDLLHSYSYSQHVGHRMLSVYRISGMSMFYILNFVLRPKRIFRLFRNIINRKEESKFENAILQIMDRFKRSKKAR